MGCVLWIKHFKKKADRMVYGRLKSLYKKLVRILIKAEVSKS